MEFSARMNYDLMYKFSIELSNRTILKNFFARFMGLFYCIYMMVSLVQLFIFLFLPHSAELGIDYFAFMTIPFIVLFDYQRKKRTKLATEQMFKQIGVSYIFVSYKVTDEGLQIQDSESIKNYTWNELDHFEIYKNFFVFYTSKAQCNVIPKESLNQESTKQLLEFIYSNLPKKKIIK